MRVYITGKVPPVCHTNRNCFGIIGNPKQVEVDNLSDIPDYYEMCIFCNPLGEINLNAKQKTRVNELRELFQEVEEVGY